MWLDLKAGESLSSHSSPGPLSLLVFKGELEFTNDETKQQATLAAGQGVLLDRKAPHSVRALGDTTCFVNAIFV